MSDFTVLTVCTGNVCRSPLAEQLLRAALLGLAEVRVRSAGTAALVGERMPEQAIAISHRLGGVGADVHLGQQLTAESLAAADLVLTATRDHRREVVEVLPRASRITFTLRELSRLIDALDDADRDELLSASGAALPDRLRLLVELAAGHRGLVVPPEAPEDDDVIDPFRRSDEIFERSAEQLVPAVKAIAQAILDVAGSGR